MLSQEGNIVKAFLCHSFYSVLRIFLRIFLRVVLREQSLRKGQQETFASFYNKNSLLLPETE